MAMSMRPPARAIGEPGLRLTFADAKAADAATSARAVQAIDQRRSERRGCAHAGGADVTTQDEVIAEITAGAAPSPRQGGL